MPKLESTWQWELVIKTWRFCIVTKGFSSGQAWINLICVNAMKVSPIIKGIFYIAPNKSLNSTCYRKMTAGFSSNNKGHWGREFTIMEIKSILSTRHSQTPAKPFDIGHGRVATWTGPKAPSQTKKKKKKKFRKRREEKVERMGVWVSL